MLIDVIIVLLKVSTDARDEALKLIMKSQILKNYVSSIQFFDDGIDDQFLSNIRDTAHDGSNEVIKSNLFYFCFIYFNLCYYTIILIVFFI